MSGHVHAYLFVCPIQHEHEYCRVFFERFTLFRREDATPYCNLLGILILDNVFKLKIVIFTYKILN